MIADDILCEELERFRATLSIPASLDHYEVRILVRLIHERLYDPDLNVANLREWAGQRNHNVSSLFKLQMGTSARAYIEELRMLAAVRVLSHESRFSIFLVATEIGYTSPELFSRTFKRNFGCAPSRFRDRRTDTASRVAA
jgi:AraC-like DNA-binding protein